MNPWRAALTSATASGKSTRMASRSAIACSSAPPCAWICDSAAPVSSTAVFSVSVANCSRCCSCTDSTCCSANSRRPRRRSSGSPPNGKPKLPSMSSSIGTAPGSVLSTRASGQLELVVLLDVAGQLVDGGQRGRDAAVAADRIEVRQRRDPRTVGELLRRLLRNLHERGDRRRLADACPVADRRTGGVECEPLLLAVVV